MSALTKPFLTSTAATSAPPVNSELVLFYQAEGSTTILFSFRGVNAPTVRWTYASGATRDTDLGLVGDVLTQGLVAGEAVNINNTAGSTLVHSATPGDEYSLPGMLLEKSIGVTAAVTVNVRALASGTLRGTSYFPDADVAFTGSVTTLTDVVTLANLAANTITLSFANVISGATAAEMFAVMSAGQKTAMDALLHP